MSADCRKFWGQAAIAIGPELAGFQQHDLVGGILRQARSHDAAGAHHDIVSLDRIPSGHRTFPDFAPGQCARRRCQPQECLLAACAVESWLDVRRRERDRHAAMAGFHPEERTTDIR